MSYVRWQPRAQETQSLAVMDYRLRRLEGQAVDYTQPLGAATPKDAEYIWRQNSTTNLDGYWLHGAPPAVEITFQVPTDDSFTYFAFGGESTGTTPEPTWYDYASLSVELKITVDGVVQFFYPFTDLLYSYMRNTKKWTEDALLVDPIAFPDTRYGAHLSMLTRKPVTLYGLDLPAGPHTLKVELKNDPALATWALPDSYAYVRNLWLRGYVQA